VRSGNDVGMNALSIRQPYVEQILRGTKRIEYRSMPTRITDQVLIYASATPGPAEEFEKMRIQPGDLPTGAIVGAVDIVGCDGWPGYYQWHLAHPLRLRTPVAPKNHPQPAWFKPF
jgi:ASCH domain